MTKFDVQFSCAYTNLEDNNTEVTIWDNGDICIDMDDARIYTNIDELEELVRQAKMFRDRRIAYKYKENSND